MSDNAESTLSLQPPNIEPSVDVPAGYAMLGSPIVPIGSLSWGSMSGPELADPLRGETTRSAAARTLRQSLTSHRPASSSASSTLHAG